MALCSACALRVHLSTVRSSAGRGTGLAGFISDRGPLSVRAFATAPARRPGTGRSIASAASTALAVPNASLDSPGQTPGSTQPDAALEWAVRKQLAHLAKDPFKVAQHVEATLQRGSFEEALMITRIVGKHLQVPVSWNHLIEYLMKKQRLNAAIKLFNEMKKRGQLPTAQTYTTIFEGCAASRHGQLGLSEAVRIYHSMLHSQRTKPNIIHMNAVLKVASRLGDLDTLFSILNTAEGQLKPDAHSYTTIINALRVKEAPWHRTSDNAELGKAEANAAYKEQIEVSIRRAKEVWIEVVEKWRKAQIVLDGHLVCAMGRVLLTGDIKANDEVLSLVEQTMGIPRLGGSSEASAEPEASSGRSAMEESGNPTTALAPPTALALYGCSPGLSVLAKSDNNVLSLVLAALGATRRTSLASRYWDLMVGEHGVVPDSENWFRLLNTLRIGKASTKAATYLEQMPEQFVRPSTVQMVMAICVSDNLNKQAFENADKVLDVMARALPKPDPRTLRLYLQAARGHQGLLRATLAETNSDTKAAGAALGKQIVHALRRTWRPIREATNDFRKTITSEEERAEVAELVATTSRMVAAIDAVRDPSMLGDATPEELVRRRATMSRYLTENTDASTGRAIVPGNKGKARNFKFEPEGPTRPRFGERSMARPVRRPVRPVPRTGSSMATLARRELEID